MVDFESCVNRTNFPFISPLKEDVPLILSLNLMRILFWLTQFSGASGVMVGATLSAVTAYLLPSSLIENDIPPPSYFPPIQLSEPLLFILTTP